MLKQVTIFTDGACIGNPGPGGYGAVLIYGDHRRELSAGYAKTTNNRMELLAAIVALKALKEPCQVTIFSDSQYVIKGIEEGWAESWRQRGWRRKKGTALNADLWQQLLDLCDKHEVTFKWVKGHAGIPENERCDHLATDAAANSATERDEVYESTTSLERLL
ncbi:MAG: ribonuclease HI [Chloroflexota bacterium]